MKVEIRSKRFPVRNLENELCLKSWHQVHYIIFHLSFKEQNDVHTIFKMTVFHERFHTFKRYFYFSRKFIQNV